MMDQLASRIFRVRVHLGSLSHPMCCAPRGCRLPRGHGSVRFSLSTYNTEKEVDFVVEHLPLLNGCGICRLSGKKGPAKSSSLFDITEYS
ncbi:MAG: hypothetical protein R2860_08730 [Desulfobacterales bacterium]